ncbi:MAG: class I SAM-dependent rRNA methyltransferase, partial [Bacteroidota bacterium]
PVSGDLVELLRYDEKFLGLGFFNPHSLIAFRFLTNREEEISAQFFERRFLEALQLRKRFYPQEETFRLVHGESDFLPGLVIDKYNEYLSLQALSFGMDLRLPMICDVLEALFHPKAIVERNDSPLRALEHLPARKKALRGTPEITIINENGCKFKVDVLNGQKTGFFLDQRENRIRVQSYVAGSEVLDCFCNEGAFSIHAALAKAQSVVGVDVSESAIANARVNATLNATTNLTFEPLDVFDALKQFDEAHKRFDVVILDPPSFTKNKKTVATALHGYKEINTLALRLINPGGFLVSASCSHHITEESFLSMIIACASKAKRSVQMVEFAGAGPDHPIIPAMPETQYLKFAIFAVR